jgi:hypothetical protein
VGLIVADLRHFSTEERLVLLGISEERLLLAVMYVREKPHATSEGIMKKSPSKTKAADQADINEILPEYDFSRGSRNKYASRYAAGKCSSGP